jgi:hypothetical protein
MDLNACAGNVPRKKQRMCHTSAGACSDIASAWLNYEYGLGKVDVEDERLFGAGILSCKNVQKRARFNKYHFSHKTMMRNSILTAS